MVEVRPTRREDLPGVREVARRTWHATYGERMTAVDIEWFLERAYSIEALENTLARQGAGHLVAIRDGNVVGYVSTGVNRDGEAELFAIYVLPELHGEGVGYQLWRAAIDRFRQLGVERFHLWVQEGNDFAIPFYERQGGMLTGRGSHRAGETDIQTLRYEFSVD